MYYNIHPYFELSNLTFALKFLNNKTLKLKLIKIIKKN